MSRSGHHVMPIECATLACKIVTLSMSSLVGKVFLIEFIKPENKQHLQKTIRASTQEKVQKVIFSLEIVESTMA